jgi:hypothetical protein
MHPVTLMKAALRSSETFVLTRVTRRNIPEDAILHYLADRLHDDSVFLPWVRTMSFDELHAVNG